MKKNCASSWLFTKFKLVEICWRFDGSAFLLWKHRQCVGMKFG